MFVGSLHFYSNFNRWFCKQTVESLTRRHILRRLIWFCTVGRCPTKKDARLKWVKWPLKNRQNKDLTVKCKLNEGRKYCRMLPLELSAILLTCIKGKYFRMLHLSFQQYLWPTLSDNLSKKQFSVFLLSGRLRQVLLYNQNLVYTAPVDSFLMDST